MALKQSLQLKQGQKLSPMQIQLIKLIKLNNLDLEQRIKDEIEINPSLEDGNEVDVAEDDFQEEQQTESEQEEEIDWEEYAQDDDLPNYEVYGKNNQSEKESFFQVKSKTSLLEHLETQALHYDFDDIEKVIVSQIIGNIDDSGYLKRSLDAIVDDLAFTQNLTVDEKMVKSVLEVVQTFEPIGVGARTLQECLLLQIKRAKKTQEGYKIALDILANNFDLFVKKHYDKLKENYTISGEELRLAIDVILKLNPKPASGSYSESSTPVFCDFELLIEDDELILNFNSKNIPELKISNEYKNMMKGFSESKEKLSNSKKDAAMFVKQKIDAAKWFIDALRQRQETLQSTVGAIIDFQKEYFLTGDKTKIKPMILKTIADIIGLDASTISRVVSRKYIQTPYGVMLLKELFSEAMSKSSGEEVSNIEVKLILKEAIDNEDKVKPLTDQKLSELLVVKGYIIARRTVAKYREMLGLPTARLRKNIS